MPDGFDALMQDVTEGHPRAPRVISFDALPVKGSPEDLTNVAFGMEYQSSKGSSRRWVTVRRIDDVTPPKMSAYCWVRRAVKSFRLDRVRMVFDQNGECMEPTVFFQKFGVLITQEAPKVRTGPQRISVTLPGELLDALDAVTNDRNAFIREAVAAELARCREK